MYKKYKKYVLLFVVVFLFLTLSQGVLALEVTYPTIPGAPAITGDSTLAQYVQYFFVVEIEIGGIIGVISIVIAGIQILIAAGNPTAISAARERILDSVLGIALLMLSFIILNTINPQLTTLGELGLPPGPGVYLMGQVDVTVDNPTGKVYKTAPTAVADTDNLEEPYTQFQYVCPPGGGKNILLSVYNLPDWEISRTENGSLFVSTHLIKCGTGSVYVKSPVLSFTWEYEEAGIYFYLTTNCTGISSFMKNASGDIPAFDFQGGLTQQVGSVKIVSGNLNYLRYGVVLNKDYSFGGECTPPMINYNPGVQCFPVPNDLDGKTFDPHSMYILHQDPFPKQRGVTLRSENLAVFLNQANDIKEHYEFGDPDVLLFADGTEYTPGISTIPNECGNDGVTCLNEIEHDGFYYTILYSENIKDKSRRCGVYLNGVSPNDLSPSKELLDNSRFIYRMDIIPTLP